MHNLPIPYASMSYLDRAVARAALGITVRMGRYGVDLFGEKAIIGELAFIVHERGTKYCSIRNTAAEAVLAYNELADAMLAERGRVLDTSA